MALDELFDGHDRDACAPADADDFQFASGDQFVHGAPAEAKRVGGLSDGEEQADGGRGAVHVYLKPRSQRMSADLLESR